MNKEEQRLLAGLIRRHRWAALATLAKDASPEASWVAYACDDDFSSFLLHLSQLSSHTKNLIRDARASLAISEAENEGDPQELARVTLQGQVTFIPRETADHQVLAKRYLQRLPEAERLFGFGDFMLFRFTPVRVRFIAGFARAYTLDIEALRNASTVC